MVNKIINCYKKDSQIGRLEFVFGLVLIAILSSILFWAYSSLVSIDIHQENYLIGKSCLELIIYVASMPIFAARLRDMEWPTYIVLLLIPMWLFSTRNLIIYASKQYKVNKKSRYILRGGDFRVRVFGCPGKYALFTNGL